MRIGELRQRLTLEAPSETVTAGEASVPWPVQATVWGSMQGLTGTDRGGLTAEVEYRIRIRYRADVSPRWRIGRPNSSRKFGIISAIDPDGRRRELVILAREMIA